MKLKYSLFLLLLAIIPLGFISCSDDDDQESTLGFKTDKESVILDIDINEESTIEIVEGTGQYEVFSTNPEVATATLSGNKITIKSVALGSTYIIVSDAGSQFLNIPVSTIHGTILLEKEEVSMSDRLGRRQTVTVNILNGNKGYSVTSKDESVANAFIINDAILFIESQGIEGETTLTVTDSKGLETTVSVTITVRTDIYTQEELEDILNDSETRFIFEGDYGSFFSAEVIYNQVENEMNLYGWFYDSWWGKEYLRVYFPGDKSVGEKPGSKLEYNYNDFIIPLSDLDKLEIIKNDGKNIWCIFSYIDPEKQLAYSGYFVSTINP